MWQSTITLPLFVCIILWVVFALVVALLFIQFFYERKRRQHAQEVNADLRSKLVQQKDFVEIAVDARTVSVEDRADLRIEVARLKQENKDLRDRIEGK